MFRLWQKRRWPAPLAAWNGRILKAPFVGLTEIQTYVYQLFFFRRTIGSITLKRFYLHYLKTHLLDQSIPKIKWKQKHWRACVRNSIQSSFTLINLIQWLPKYPSAIYQSATPVPNPSQNTGHLSLYMSVWSILYCLRMDRFVTSTSYVKRFHVWWRWCMSYQQWLCLINFVAPSSNGSILSDPCCCTDCQSVVLCNLQIKHRTPFGRATSHARELCVACDCLEVI